MEARTVVRLVLALVTLSILAALPSTAGAVGFKYGVTAGEVTSSSAVLWGRATGKATVKLQVARNKRFRGRSVKTYKVKARKSHNYTVQRKVKRLRSGKRYWFRFVSGHRKSPKGTFKTAPKRTKNARIRFGFTGDTDFNATPGQTRPFWNKGGVFSRLKAERNAFNVHLGDTIYSDSEVPGPAQPDRAHRRAEVGQVPHQPGHPAPARPARVGGLLLALGRPRVRQRLLAPGEHVRQQREHQRSHAVQPQCQGVPRLCPCRLLEEQGSLPQLPLGQEPRGVLPRRALVPLGQRRRESRLRQPADGRARPGADGAAVDARRCSPRWSRRSASPCRRHASTRSAARTGPTSGKSQLARFKNGGQPVDRALEGGHERAADPAVLRAAVRPLGGLRGGAPEPAAVPPRQRQERDLPDDGRPRDAGQRCPAPDARAGGTREHRDLRLHGRSRGHARTSPARSTARLGSPGRASSSAPPSSSHSRPTAWGCAARSSTSSATER